jgi:uncharacterized protein YbjT (DUF2867 family)
VTAIARHPDQIAKLPNVTPVQGDVYDEQALIALLKGHEIVISAVHFTASDPRILMDAVKQAGAKRYLVVGGAGSLEVAPGVKLIDTPNFPAAYKLEAGKGPGNAPENSALGRISYWSARKAAAFHTRTMRSRWSTKSTNPRTVDGDLPWVTNRGAR